MRTLSSAAIAVLNGPVVPLVLLLELAYPAPIRANSTTVDIDHFGVTFFRTGSLGAVDGVRDSTGEITGMKFSLSGVPSENIALSLGDRARGRLCKLWSAVLDPDTHAVLDTSLIFAGELDQTSVSQEGSSCTIGVTAIHMGTLFKRPRTLNQTESAQQHLYPGDTSRRFLVSQANHKDVWPAASFYRR